MRLTPAVLSSLSIVSGYSSGCPSKCSCYGTRVDCSNQGLMEIPDHFPSGVRSVDLSHNHIKKIDAFPPEMTEATTLNLANNQITFIEYDAFDNLDELLNLDLSNNKLQNFEDDVFEWNPLKLKSLNLSHNLFESIHHFLFFDLNNLVELDISNNNLAWIHPHSFDDSTKLEHLNLSHNKLKYFKYHWVQKIVDANLVSLNLLDNDFKCDCALKDDGHFLSDDNKVEFLEFVLKKGQSQDLNRVSIDCTGPDNTKHNILDFKNANVRDDFVKKHPCQKPRVTGISKDSTVENGKTLLLKCLADGQPFPQIEWEAPNNDIYRLQSDEFEGITVHMDGSLLIENIRKADRGDYTCRAHNSAGESHAKTSVEIKGDDPKGTENWGNRDDDAWEEWGENDENEDYWNPADDKFYGDAKFDEVEVHHDVKPTYEKEWQQEKDCPSGCSCATNVVDCGSRESSPLFSLPSRIPKIATHLDMNENSVTKLDNVCRNYDQLRELKLDNNDLTEIKDEAFEDCNDMVILTMRHNKLTEINKDTFIGLGKVQILVLDNNDLTSLPADVFSNLRDLEYLYIRENDIHEIDENAFQNVQSLRYVHLEHNRLSTLKKDWLTVLSKNTSIKRVFLGDNSIICDERLSDFAGHFDNEQSKLYQISTPNDLKCNYPADNQGKFLASVDYKSLPKNDGKMDAAEGESSGGASGGFIFVGILIGALLAGFGIIAWRKWNRRNGMSSFRHISYTDVTQEEEPLQRNGPNAGHGDQELFI